MSIFAEEAVLLSWAWYGDYDMDGYGWNLRFQVTATTLQEAREIIHAKWKSERKAKAMPEADLLAILRKKPASICMAKGGSDIFRYYKVKFEYKPSKP